MGKCLAMRTKRCWLLVTAIALLPACGDDTDEVAKKDAAADASAAKDTLAADVAPDLAETLASPDNAPDLAPADLALAVETGRPDQVSSTEAGGIDLPTVVDLARGPEVQVDAGKLDVALPDAAPDVAGEAAAPPSYTCRDDSDCCIKVDHCMAKAYLYSKAPGASPAPSIPTVTDPGQCLRCMTPAVQVRCDQRQCVGEQVGYSGSLTQDHCGTIAQPDAGAVLYYQRAYAGAQQISWGC
jgi:hypothetical protein